MNKRGRGLFIVSFLAPAVLIYAGMVIYPLIQAFAFSAYRWTGYSNRRTFIGGENFSKLFHDSVFWKSVQNNLLLYFIGGVVILVIAVAVAHGLQGKGPMAKTLRGVVLFPQMISLVAVAILWMFIFNPQFGLVNSFLNAVGLGGFLNRWLGGPGSQSSGHLAYPWLSKPGTALFSLGISFAWYATGFYIMLFAAGLKAIPSEIQEAAALDGAVGLKRFWRVTWPMLWSVKRIAVVHLAITVINIFTLDILLTPSGGPDHSTEMMLTYLYRNAFQFSKFGYATAIAVVNFLIVMLLSVGILLAFRRDPSEPRTA